MQPSSELENIIRDLLRFSAVTSGNFAYARTVRRSALGAAPVRRGIATWRALFFARASPFRGQSITLRLKGDL
mgnify:CR=1 FL=1